MDLPNYLSFAKLKDMVLTIKEFVSDKMSHAKEALTPLIEKAIEKVTTRPLSPHDATLPLES
eukprot:9309072-Pyramimonas_sp.AAC.2